jgi:hypothetical protein
VIKSQCHKIGERMKFLGGSGRKANQYFFGVNDSTNFYVSVNWRGNCEQLLRRYMVNLRDTQLVTDQNYAAYCIFADFRFGS